MTDSSLPVQHYSKAHHLRRSLQRAKGSHVICRVGRVEIKTVHVKATCAYGGALMLGIDFGFAVLGPALCPHLYPLLDPLVSIVCGKAGAFISGAAVFFDRIIEW